MRPSPWFARFSSALFARKRHPQAFVTKLFEFRNYLESLENRLAPAVFTVLNTADSGAGSFRQAILDANSTVGADTINFNATAFATPQTITLTSGVMTLTDSALTTITGPGQALVTVSGNNADRVMSISVGASASLSDLTITKGAVTGWGGSVKNEGTLTMTDCTVTGSSASQRGGGLANYAGGIVTLTDCTFSGNTASFQGAALQNSGKMTVNSSNIHSNTVSGSGGGINAQGAGPLIVTNTTITGNSCSGSGGGIAANGTVTLTGTTISGNTSSGTGGGVLEYSSTMSATNCTITGNTSGTSGGGFYMRFGSLTLRNVTVTANKASSGGGINNTGGAAFSIRNSIVSANTATTGTDINGTLTTDLGTNLFGTALSGTATGTGNVFNDTPMLGALADNFGPTMTMLPLLGSPAIGAGDNTGGPALDQRGFTRFVGTGVNIGAVDALETVVTNTSDSGAGSLRQAILDTNATAGIGTIAFSIPGAGVQTIPITSGGVPGLPVLTEGTVIDGWSQGGLGYTGAPLIELDGTLATDGVIGSFGLNIQAKYSAVRGLAINRFPNVNGNGYGIGVFGTVSSVRIYGNYIGTNAAGTAAAANGQGGIWIGSGATAVTIGTNADGIDDAAERNIISGNAGNGIRVDGSSNIIAGNFIGTNAAGTTKIANTGAGIMLNNAASLNMIGGTTAAARNIISGNISYGVDVNASNNTVAGNYIGTNAAGTAAVGNGDRAVYIHNAATGVTVGGTTAGARNVISGNTGDAAVFIGNASNNTVAGNYIGTNAAGTAAIANTGTGVIIDNGASGNIIGGTIAAARNIISGNQQRGVEITSDGNLVQGNYIGTDVTGAVPLGNGTTAAFSGVFISSAANTIGGGSAGAGNVISSNAGNGIVMTGSGATGNLVAGNIIGLNAAGTAVMANAESGVVINLGASSNTIGGTSAAARNIISGNIRRGVEITSNGNLVQGNYIGTDKTGAVALGNGTTIAFSGVFISSAGNTIGGSAAGAGNVISGNGNHGVNMSGSGVTGNLVAGNIIGLNAAGTAALANADVGVQVEAGASSNTIGGASAGARNVISGNSGNGVLIQSAGTTGNVVAGNYIGLDFTGTVDLGNAQDGVALNSGTTNNTIGGTVALARNVISGNDAAGVIFRNSGTKNNSVIGNYIGTDLTGMLAVSNFEAGVTLAASSQQNTIGGTTAAERNVISGNRAGGVRIENNSSANVVIGNYIGVDKDGVNPIGSGFRGVHIGGGASGNSIGGTAPGAGNIITSSSQFGVVIENNTSVGNSIRGNSIYSNSGLGIDLGADGVTANDSKGHTGPNNYQNFPVLTFVGAGATTNPRGTLNASPNKTYTLDFYASNAADPSGYGEGKRYLGSSNVTTNALGQAKFSPTLASATTTNEFVSVTATDASGNTSEFSQSVLTDLLPTVNLDTPSKALIGITLPFTPVLTDTLPGNTYRFSWAVTFNGTPVVLPNSSYVSNSATDQETFIFTPQRTGSYVALVTVTDNRGGETVTASNAIQVSATTLGVTIMGNPLGTPAPFAVVSGQPVTLTSRIADPRETAVDPKTGAPFFAFYSYAWSITRNGLPFALPAGTVTNAGTLTFTPTASGLYLASLAVADGIFAAGADSVSMYNTAAPSAEVIVSPGTAVTAGTRVNLQTVVTDVALRQGLSYAWTITPDNGQPVITATNTTGAYAFTATAAGNYAVSVTITDDHNRTGVSTPVLVHVSGAAPRVTINGAPFTTAPGAPVTLTGTATDADPNQAGSGSANTYSLSWSTSATAGSVSPATGSGSSFTFTPSAAGTVVVYLTATDQLGAKTTTPAVINVAAATRSLTLNAPASPAQGQLLTWTAALSPAVAGTTYSWSVFAPNGITSTFNTGTSNMLTLPTGALPGRYDVTATAHANGFDYTAGPPQPGTFVVVPQSPVTVSIAVSAPTPPQPSHQEGDTITLTGTATEPGVDLTNLSKASYLWTVTGPGGFSQVGVLPTLKVQPLVAGSYSATLTVRDFTGGVGTASKAFAVAHVPPKPLLRYLDTAANGSIGLQAVVSNPGNAYSFTYSVQLNGLTYILPTPGGTAFTFRVPPLAGATLVAVTVTDSAGAIGQLTATLRSIAPGTPTAPVQRIITAADLLPGSKVVVALATGNNHIFADSLLTAATTVEFVAVGGNNKFYGGPSTNIFQGDSGTNELIGGSGPNLFFASGNDTLIGGSGSNLYVPVTVDASTGNVLQVTAGSGANTIDLSRQFAVSLNLAVTGSAQPFDGIGNSVMLSGIFQQVLGSAGADTLIAASGASILGGGGNDLLQAFNASNVTLAAGSGQATLQASGGSNVLMLGGRDANLLTATNVSNVSMLGGSGNNDSLVAGDGSEFVSMVGGSGNNDSLVAMDGSDNVTMIGGSGSNDSLVAMDGSEFVSMVGGSGHNDSLIAYGDNVTMIGGSGHNDSLVAGDGAENVTMIGGSGSNDSLIALDGSDGISMLGGSGNNDSLVAEAGAENVTMVGGSGSNDSLVAMDGSDGVSMLGGSGSNDSLVAMDGAENVTMIGGSGNNDSLVAQEGSRNILIVGGSGHNDSLVARGENITVLGGSGSNDSLVAGDGAENVTMIGGSGNNDSLIAERGSINVLIVGGSGHNDTLVAMDGSDGVSLVGGSGSNDSLVAAAEAENVLMVGGSGNNDSLVAMDGSENVTMIGGSGNNDSLVAMEGSRDILMVGGSGHNDSLVARGENITVLGGSGSNDSLVAGDGAVDVLMVGGSGHNDSLVADDGSVGVTMIGGSGNNDSLVAMDGSADVSMVGGSGNNDSLVARSGSVNVIAVGGSGNNDSLVAEAGAENVTLIGGSGNNDSLVAEAGAENVLIVGGSGHNDSLVAEEGSTGVSLIGGSGSNDTLVAMDGCINVLLVGGSGNNDSLLATNAEDVSLIGGSGNGTHLAVVNSKRAVLLGGMGSNLMLSATGASSDVVLVGGYGNNDSLIAGPGVSGAELVGGFGHNDYLEATGASNVVLVGGYGNNDSLTTVDSDNVTLLGGSGDNALLRRIGGSRVYMLGQSGNNDSLISDGGDGEVSLVGGSGNNLYLSDTGSNHVSLFGGSGHNNSLISVNGTNVTLFGGNGNNDSILASGGSNIFAVGGLGNGNVITASNLLNTTLFGGAGHSNTITNSNGMNVLVVGGTGIANVLTDINGTNNTLVNGGNQFASLTSSGGQGVRLFGGGGTDHLSAIGGNDIGLFGQNGNNTYSISGSLAKPFTGYLDALGAVGFNQTSTDQQQAGTNTILFPTADKVTLDLGLTVGGAATASAAASATQSVATGVSFYMIGMFTSVVGSATGNDFIRGNALNNSLVAGAGNATLLAGSGDAVLVAGPGNNSLVGGGGRTTYALRTPSGHHTITQTNPNNFDVVDLSGLNGPATLNLSSASTQTVAGALTLQFTHPTIPDVLGSPFGNTLTGNNRDNRITLSSGNNTMQTGSGQTTLKFTGKSLGTNAIAAPAPGSVLLNFHQLDQPLTIDLSHSVQNVAGGTVAFVTPTGSKAVTGVVGTIFSDVLAGNPAPGSPGVSFYGGGGRDTLIGGAGDDFLQAGVPQVVLLDFDTYTPLSAGNHVYTQVERDAIQQRMENVYSAFQSSASVGPTDYANGFVFTQDPSAARSLTRPTGGDYVTIYFNKPPVGGQAEEVDFANANLGGTASVDAGRILGTANQPDPTTENFINLSAGLAVHELAHLSGLRHTDSFGPIGSGAYQVFAPDASQIAGINGALFVPAFAQPATAQPVIATTSSFNHSSQIPVGSTVFAAETPLHVMGSPASLGISRFDTLQDIFFGEREAIRLAFDQGGVILHAQAAPHDSAAAAQNLGALPGLVVPNTLAAGTFREGESFAVSAVAVIGSIGLDGGGLSRSDWYSFAGHAGEIMSFETISNVMPGNAAAMDTILRVYDAAGNLLVTNDDELESRDSLIFDFVVPADGKYFVQVDTFSENPATNTTTGDYVLYMTSFALGASRGGGSTLIAGPGSDVLYGGQGNNLFRLAPGITGPVTIIAGNGEDVLDRTAAPLAAVNLITPAQNTSISQLLGTPPALQFPAGLANHTIPKGNLLHFSAAITNPGRSVTYSLAPAAGLAPVGATIRSTDGEFNWTAGTQGTYQIQIVATASDGATAAVTVTIVVTAVAPTLAPIANQTAPVGTAVALRGSVINPVATDPYTFAWTITANSLTVATFTGRDAVFNPGVSGAFTATLTVTDVLAGLSSTTTSTITVTEVAPVVNPLPNASIRAGDSTSFAAGYSYPGSAASLMLTWTVKNSANVTVSTTTTAGTDFTFTAPDADVYTVSFTVTTASGVSRTASAQMTAATVPPTATPPAAITLAEGTAATLAFTNPFSPASAITAAGFRYSFALSPGLLVSTFNAAAISPSYLFNGNDIGTFTVYGRILDKNNAFRDYSTQVTVANVAIVPAGAGPFAALKGTTTETLTVATFSDAGGPESLSRYAASIDWGDGTSSAGTIGAPVAGAIPVTGSHTYATQGEYTIRVSITHDTLPAVAVTDAVTVTAPALIGSGGFTIPTLKNADTGPVLLAAFTDPTGPDALGTYAAIIQWGDGTTSAGQISLSGSTYSVTGSHTYASIGVKAIAVTLKHQGSPDVAVSSSATVVNPALVAQGTGIAATRNSPTGLMAVATFTDPGGPDALATYSATINWGDGSPNSAGIISLDADGRTFHVQGDHTYAAEATYSIGVTIQHVAAPTATVSSSATVANPAVSLTFAPFAAIVLAPLTNQLVATFSDPSGADAPSSYTALINWGDGSPATAGTIGAPVAGVFPVRGTHTYTTVGTYTVTVTVVHGSSPQAIATGSVLVEYGQVDAVGVGTISLPAALPNSPVVATFTDPNGPGALGLYSATIFWGDGTTSPGNITGPVAGVFSVSATHTYFVLGAVSVSVSITRGAGDPVTVTSTANVGTSIVALNPTLSGSVSLSGSPTISIGGALVIDSKAANALTAKGSPQIIAGSIRIVGGYSATGSSQITPVPATNSSGVADPLAALPVPANPGGTTLSAVYGGNATVTLNPGRYSQIRISGSANVTLNPGIYVIAGGGFTVRDQATVTGNGVLIYVAGSNFPSLGGSLGGISFSGSPTVTLHPAATGAYAGITFFQARDNNLAVTFSGGAQYGVNGFLYAPNALLNLTGSISTVRMGIIVDRLNTSGNATSGLVTSGTASEDGQPAGEFLSTSLFVYVNSGFSTSERARITAAITSLDLLIATYNVDIVEVTDPALANVTLHFAATTLLGGMTNGVLAAFDPVQSAITLVSGWNWFDGENPEIMIASQFDFQTVVLHELGHALGLGHLPDAASVMFDTLAPGAPKRMILHGDLNIGNEHGLPGALFADLSRFSAREPSAGIAPMKMEDGDSDVAVRFDRDWAVSVVRETPEVARHSAATNAVEATRTAAANPSLDVLVSSRASAVPVEWSAPAAKRGTISATATAPASVTRQQPEAETSDARLTVSVASPDSDNVDESPSIQTENHSTSADDGINWTDVVMLGVITAGLVALAERPAAAPPPGLRRDRRA